MRRVLAAALFAFLLLPAGADAADRKPPKIVKAAMQDADGDGRADGVLVTFSEKVRHAKDAKKPFPFAVAGYTVTTVGKASGKKKILVKLTEGLVPDGAAHPVIRYKRTKSKPVRDGAGNQAKRGRFRSTLPFDAVPPETLVTLGPSGLVSTRSASFGFSSEPFATFLCRLDTEPFDPCSPAGKDYTDVADGTHTFQVQAVDRAGNKDVTPAEREWTVDGDGDGAIAPADCAPDDAAIHPGALDVPEPTFTDKNCDGIDGDKAEAIFVSPAGTNAAGCGTFAAPCLAVQIGLARATAQSKRDVYLAAGTYAGPVSLVNDVDVFGGFSATWVRSSATTGANQSVTITGGFDGPTGHFLAVKAVSLANATTLADVRVLGPDAAGAGASSYGVVVQSSASITLTRVIVVAGDGVDGSIGANGTSASQTAAATGGTGGDGTESSVPEACNSSTRGAAGPGSGNASASDPTRTQGGAGGRGGTRDTSCSGGLCGLGFGGDCTASAGEAGANAFVSLADTFGIGGAAGPANSGGCNSGGGTVGGAGLPGHVTDGLGGGGGSSSQFVGSFWFAKAGAAGINGVDGTGGGGGGGGGGCDEGTDSSGPGGGGGGAGGAKAPAAGSGGGGGGGSFAIFATSSSITVTNSTLVGGSAGDGGPGGSGGSGQPGGAGGPGGGHVGASGAGAGGAGARGGNSGGGGGGRGGFSFLIYSLSSVVAQSSNQFTSGTAGSGGSGGTGPVHGQAGTGGTVGSMGTCASAPAC